MAHSGFLGTRSPPRPGQMGGGLEAMDANHLIDHLVETNQAMVAAAAQWEESAATEQRELQIEIAGLRARCTEYEAIIAENEEGLKEQLAESARTVKGLTQALQEEASVSLGEVEELRREVAELHQARHAAKQQAKAAEKTSKTLRKEVNSLRKELAAARDAKGMSKQDMLDMEEEVRTAQNERRAMEKELETMRKKNEGTEDYKKQTMVYLKRYENQIASLEREVKRAREENAEMVRAQSMMAMIVGRKVGPSEPEPEPEPEQEPEPQRKPRESAENFHTPARGPAAASTPDQSTPERGKRRTPPQASPDVMPGLTLAEVRAAAGKGPSTSASEDGASVAATDGSGW